MLALSVIATCFASATALAQGPPLVLKINEVNREDLGEDPQAGTYIEVFNVTDAIVSLGDYRLVTGDGSFTVPLADVFLSSGEYWVACDTEGTAVPDCDLQTADLVSIAEADVIELQFDLTGAGTWVTEDSVSFVGATPAPPDGTSTWSTSTGRIPDGVDTNLDNLDFKLGCLTPGNSNVSTDGCLCGNNVMDDGESCDDGPDNAGTDCGCQLDCQLAPLDAPCGDGASGLCNDADSCDGEGVCQTNVAENGTSCGNGLFCDGLEICSEGSCLTGTVPCGAEQICDEGMDECFTPGPDAGPDANDAGLDDAFDVGSPTDDPALDVGDVGPSTDGAADVADDRPTSDVETDSEDARSSPDVAGRDDPGGVGEAGTVGASESGCSCVSAAVSRSEKPALLLAVLVFALRGRFKRRARLPHRR